MENHKLINNNSARWWMNIKLNSSEVFYEKQLLWLPTPSIITDTHTHTHFLFSLRFHIGDLLLSVAATSQDERNPPNFIQFFFTFRILLWICFNIVPVDKMKSTCGTKNEVMSVETISFLCNKNNVCRVAVWLSLCDGRSNTKRSNNNNNKNIVRNLICASSIFRERCTYLNKLANNIWSVIVLPNTTTMMKRKTCNKTERIEVIDISLYNLL